MWYNTREEFFRKPQKAKSTYGGVHYGNQGMYRGITYIIKEIKFTDLGTDEAAANLFRKRSLGWMYYNAQTTGIEDITTDAAVEGSDAPAVYYNLQGVQIKNPENGIYIVRRGNQVTKEYIR